MQHHLDHDGAASPYRLPPTKMVSFLPQQASGTAPVGTNIPPPTRPQPVGTSFEELAGGGGATNFHDDDDMPVDTGCGRSASEAGAGGSGNRWPREETLALIRIRSEMDAAFRNSPLKAPVWEEVSRKLAELGYHRSAKKCKEKFENVDKYYKRTKEGRAGRQDGKSYRFFSELEALHAAAPQQQHQSTAPMAAAACTVSTTAPQDPQPLAMARIAPHPGAGLPDLSFSSNSESESDDESDDEEEAGGSQEGFGKLTCGEGDGDGGGNKTMMALFEGMMKQITEKQDAMQRLFLETLEKWEAERTAREEAWRRQEVARVSREREQHAKERAAATSRDAALIAFLQRVGGKSVPLPPTCTCPVAAPTPMPVPLHLDASASSSLLAPPKVELQGRAPGGESSGGMLSRWPKEEVQALIQLRMEKDEHYQDTGPKGPLWEDISAGMRRIGYNRSSKRCKEKWENINKYFKKVKKSNKRRPEDSKTCPYFHQLDAIYRKKHFAAMTGSGSSAAATGATSAAVVTASEQDNPRRELEGKISNDFDRRYSDGGGIFHAPPGSVQTATATAVLDEDSATNKKAEDVVMTTTGPNVQSQHKEFAAPEGADSDDIEGNYYTDEGDDDDRMKYKIEFQKPKESGSSSAPAPATTAAAVTSSAPTGSTFLAVE